MTDAEKRLRQVAQAAAEVCGPHWKWLPCGDPSEGWVESVDPDRSVMSGGYEGEWRAAAGLHAVAFCPAVALGLLDRIEALEADSSALVADLQEQDARVEALATAARRGGAELRHAFESRDVNGAVDADIVRRAVAMLEEAKTQWHPEKMP